MPRSLESLALVRLLRRGSKRLNFEMAALVVFAGLANAGVLAIINTAAENASNARSQRPAAGPVHRHHRALRLAQRYILFTSITEVERDSRRHSREGGRPTCAGRPRVARAPGPRRDLRRGRARDPEHLAGGLDAGHGHAGDDDGRVQRGLPRAAVEDRLRHHGGGVRRRHLLHLRRGKVADPAMLGEAQRKENEFLGAADAPARRLQGSAAAQGARRRPVPAPARGVGHRRGRQDPHRAASSRRTSCSRSCWSTACSRRSCSCCRASSPEYSGVVLKLTAAVLFIIGPLGSIVNAVPIFSAANVAAQNIFDIEAQLTASSAGQPERAARGAAAGGLLAHSPAAHRVPVSRSRHAAASSGSARSTSRSTPARCCSSSAATAAASRRLLKALTGLYHPQSGSVTMDDTLVSPETATLVPQPLRGGVQRVPPVRSALRPGRRAGRARAASCWR